ncbi:MAG: FAD-binding protein, partial [Archaeoglobus sp.]|uniref:FAD-dependent oxidoreductase n=1 Tax=Archaeoglobus sp. TaxID=1872626 RepID=UPI001DB01E3D
MEDSRFKISRRQFLTIAGATAGIAAMGYAFRWFSREPFIENESDIDEDKFTEEFVTTDVLVIGGGMAGLFAAVKAHDAGAKVLMVSKGRLGCSGQTPFAKGFFVFDEKTSPYTLDEYVDAVTRSALGSNNRAYTRQVAMYSKDRAEELKKWGFFDSSLCHKPFLRPIKERGIEVKERVMVTHLIKENGVIAGAAGFSLDEEKIYF